MAVAKYSTQNDPTATQVVECEKITYTGNATLTADQSDQRLLNHGLSQIDLTLPPAVVNLNFKMCVIAAQKFQFICAGTDKILWQSIGTPGSNTKLWSNELGATIEIECLVAGTWHVVNTQGLWNIDI